jgi:hypothetical protein
VPLYEVVLRFPDRNEVRLTDRTGFRTGEETLVGGERFLVTGTEAPEALRADRRFVLEPCGRRRPSVHPAG